MEIPVKEAVDGDILRADAVGPDGTVLLSSGTRLSAERLGLLKERGVAVVDVRRGAPPGEKEVEEAIAELDHMFSDVRGDPIMDKVHDVARGMLERVRHQG